MIISSKTLAAIVVVALFGGILFSSAMGWWETKSTKQAARFTGGEFAGQADPADIRGSYTFADIDSNFGVPPAVLAEAFGVEAGNAEAYAVKDLESRYGGSAYHVGTSSVRLFVAWYLGMPYTLGADTYLPESAVRVLRTRNLSSEQVAYLEAHTVPDSGAGPAVTPEPSDHAAPGQGAGAASDSDRTIKGKTTFADLLDWGVPQATIERVLGASLPAQPSIRIRNYCVASGLRYETVRTALQAEVDRLY